MQQERYAGHIDNHTSDGWPLSCTHFPSQLSRSMMKHHLEQSTLAQRSEKEELQRLRKIASSIAKEVKHFWESVRKVVQC